MGFAHPITEPRATEACAHCAVMLAELNHLRRALGLPPYLSGGRSA